MEQGNWRRTTLEDKVALQYGKAFLASVRISNALMKFFDVGENACRELTLSTKYAYLLCLARTFRFAKHWLPYCKKFNVGLRSPVAYFASLSVSDQSDPDFSKIKILIDSRDEEKKDIDGVRLPTFVYVAQEKHPQHFHNSKLGR
ncbi:hypothetical protein FXO37_01859 [Capsicum annuum]|nr:hypothetical protein FXO37_01859 [Capsicum annuum]